MEGEHELKRVQVEVKQYFVRLGFESLTACETMDFDYYFDNYMIDLERWKEDYRQKLIDNGWYSEVIGQNKVHTVTLLS